MQRGWLYINHSANFIKKTWNLGSIPKKDVLVMANVVGVYPGIPHKAGLKKALREVLDKRKEHTILTNELIRMTEFVLKNNHFQFNGQTKQQISGTATGIKFGPPYACLFMDKIETVLLETQELQASVWFRYIDNFFLSGQMVSKNFELF